MTNSKANDSGGAAVGVAGPALTGVDDGADEGETGSTDCQPEGPGEAPRPIETHTQLVVGTVAEHHHSHTDDQDWGRERKTVRLCVSHLCSHIYC